MSRIRNVKPEFFTHEGLQDLELANAGKYPMFVFEGLWTKCDRNGVFEWRPRSLKLAILPFLPFEIEETLDILAGAGYIKKYMVDGKNYGIIPTFKKHQSICDKERQNKNIFPLPPANSETGREPEQDGFEADADPGQKIGNPTPENTNTEKTEENPSQDGFEPDTEPTRNESGTVPAPSRNTGNLSTDNLKSDNLKSHIPKSESADSEKGVCEDLTDPKKLFLNYWRHTPDIFNFMARIEYPKDWERFWKSSGTTCEQVKTALENFTAGVRAGDIERRYVPSTPDRFVLNGWILKCQTRFQAKTAPPSGAAPPSKPQKKSLF
jgi:hypothetical protein